MATTEDIARVEYRKSGVPLAEVSLNEDRLAAEVAKNTQFTVVSQSIRSGSTVARGTVVDVTVTTTSRLPVGVIAVAPSKWQDIEIGRIAAQVRGKPKILQLMAEKDTFDKVDGREREELVSFLAESELMVGEDELASAYSALRSAHLLSD
ncbi:hypothetical protein BE21_19250 [Sorangium cellulosum]|uniref:PASTA domain-containing protein n=1 Tax=Sorangium cellulosum TaxID=56 RepID=A0A150TXJ3_SORCE|nr:hypothetical protein BE21_19250 [Sorangium cellulosum]